MHQLCSLDAINEGDTLGFKVGDQSIILIKKAGRIVAYHNSCPHLGVELNWMPDKFLDISKQFLQCSTHGAQFRIDDGFCVAGPCTGSSLTSLDIAIREQSIYIRLPDPIA